MTDLQPQPPAAPPAPRSTARRRALAAAREVAVVVVSALVLSLLVKTFLVQAFVIPSESMHDTLVEGDRILVNELVPGPFDLQRGDVVVFADPGGWLDPPVEEPRGPVVEGLVAALAFVGVLPQDSGQHLVKRLIGLPGDHVACTPGGPTTVNGVALDESYLAAGADPCQDPFDVVVPAGALWVEGDNREHSGDSRRHLGEPGGGMVPVDDVVGRAVVTAWPLDRLAWLSRHGDVFAAVPAAG